MFVITAILGASVLSPSAASVTTCDVNCDGIVNGKDIVRVLKYVKNPTAYPYDQAMDVNADGSITRKDITAMRSFIGQSYDITELKYIVCDPYFNCTAANNGGKLGTYTTLESAKTAAQEKLHLGYVVYDSLGKFIYTPTDSLLASKILWNAKLISDFAAKNNFDYWDATTNPGYNWQNLDINNPTVSDERISSCDRLVDWTLWRCGYTSAHGNVISHGLSVFQQPAWLESLGFTKITDNTALHPGDIVFTIDDATRPGYPAHVFICASYKLNNSNYYYRYDHGSGTRIQTTSTPFYEPIPATGPTFYYAYRPPVK